MILLSLKGYLKENDCFQKNSTPKESKAFPPPKVLSFGHERENITRQNEKIPFSSK